MDLWPGYAFTPDGKSLVFSNKGKISRLDVATGAVADIPFTAAGRAVRRRRASPGRRRSRPGPVKAKILRWPSQSADGRWIAFEAFGRVWLQELSGGKTVGAPRRLTKDDASLPHREYAPAFSADGTWIAYVSWSDAEGGHVWKAAAAPGVAPVRLTRSPGHYANPGVVAEGRPDRAAHAARASSSAAASPRRKSSSSSTSSTPASGDDHARHDRQARRAA